MNRKRRVSYAANIPTELLERLRDVAYWEPGESMSSLTESALRVHLGKLEKKRGTPYPPRRGSLKVGPRPR